MKKLLGLAGAVLAAILLYPAGASAASLPDCLSRQHVCVSGTGRALVSASQEAQLERQIGKAGIYLVVAPAGSSGYDPAMRRIISALNGHSQFTVGFLDSQQRHFGAYSKGMLPAGGAAAIATQVVQQHKADGDIFAALTEFVREVRQQAAPGGSGTPAGSSAHVLTYVLIALGIVVVLGAVGFFLIARPARQRRERELQDVKAAAQDDLIALSTGITDHGADVTIQSSPEAVEEQAAALSAYERGTAALDAARRLRDMGAVSRAIATGQYHLACAEALAAGKPRPPRRPSCFFDPRHGMSVRDVDWAPAAGGPSRSVPACPACAHKVDEGIEPEMRRVEVGGTPVGYAEAGFAPAYWGGYGFGPGMFTGFLLGQALMPYGGWGFPGDGDSGDGDFGDGDFGGGDFGDGDFGGGDFGGGDFGGGDFGGGGFS